MRDYGKVRTAFWTDDRVSGLSDDGKLLALYLMTSPHANAVGCYRLPSGYVSDDMGWDRPRVERAFRELAKARFALRCERTGWTLIVNYLRHNEIENGNVGKACVRMLEQVPSTVPFADALVRAITPSQERFPNGFLERYAERFPKGMPTPEPEPSLEPSVEADASTGAAAAAPDDVAPSDKPDLVTEPTDAELVWGDGLSWLSKASGKAQSGLRSMVGRWCSVYGAESVLIAMSDCRSQSPPVPGPVAWIEAALKTRKTANDRHRQPFRPTQRRSGLLELREQELGLGAGNQAGGLAGWDGTSLDLEAAGFRVA
ncbi:MAG: hypothetical protein ACLGJC_09560 [Alphaproteobacteria bacterium]